MKNLTYILGRVGPRRRTKIPDLILLFPSKARFRNLMFNIIECINKCIIYFLLSTGRITTECTQNRSWLLKFWIFNSIIDLCCSPDCPVACRHKITQKLKGCNRYFSMVIVVIIVTRFVIVVKVRWFLMNITFIAPTVYIYNFAVRPVYHQRQFCENHVTKNTCQKWIRKKKYQFQTQLQFALPLFDEWPQKMEKKRITVYEHTNI